MMKRLIIILLVIISGCDLISTRNPEQPDSRGNNFVTAITPDFLFQNFKNAFKDKVEENYIACFVDPAFSSRSFKFIPSAGTALQLPGLSNWNLESERQYFNNLKSSVASSSPITLLLTDEVKNLFGGDSAIYQYDYSLSITSTNQSLESEYKGTAQFKIISDSRGQWVISEWLDIKKNDFPSWSELKGRLY